MTDKQVINLLTAQLILAIWDPDKYTIQRNKLFARAKGIVLHDRALNGVL